PFYLAVVENVCLLTFNSDTMKKRIDAILDSERDKEPGRNAPQAGVLLSPTAKQAGLAVHQYLEWLVHGRALGNAATWQALYRAGVVTAKMSESERQEAAFRLLGYVPISPDGSAYRFDPATGEVVSARHGSYRKPELNTTLLEGSPLDVLLKEVKGLRVE